MLKQLVFLFLFLEVAFGTCDYVGTFQNEKGGFSISWGFPSSDQIQISFTIDGNAYVAIGFGGSMYDADMVVGWTENNGSVPVVGDYFSEEEGMPKLDTALGGTSDIISSSASSTETATTVTFTRKLTTGDEFDHDISATEPNDMIYAWGVSDETGLSYHGDNHNHVNIDFSKSDGIPDTSFGEEESGQLSRELVQKSFYGTLSTVQTQAAGASGVYNYPYGSVADMADEEPSTGRPLILLSDLERNVVNLADNPRMSIEFISTPSTIQQFQHPEYYDVMTKPRTTLLGELEMVPDGPELHAAKDTYLKKHPEAAAWINFSDFHMYRMVVQDVYVVGGFGNTHYIGWISPQQYYSIELA